MGYIIKELKGEELAKQPDTPFVLIEKGFRPIKLGNYASRADAEKATKEWIARDELESDIEDFDTEMRDKYEGRLSDEEIHEMIKGS